MFENSYKVRVSARAIIINNDTVLLNRFGNGVYYNFPGGGIEKGENALQAVVREVQEETSLIVSAKEMVFALEYEPCTGKQLYGNGHHISFFFRCDLVGDAIIKKPTLPDIDPNNPALVSSPEWIPIKDLLSLNILPHINKNVIDYLDTGIFLPRFFEEPYITQ